MYEALASDCRTYVELLGASHCQFAEYNFLCNLGESGCPSPTISRSEQHALTLALLQPWLDHFLKDDPQAWVDFQGLLTSHTGIVYLQDCEGSGVAEPGDLAAGPQGVPMPRLALAAGRIGSPILTFAVELPAAGPVALSIYDITGRCVRALARETVPPGRHEFAWNGTDDRGLRAATGCYFCRLDSHPESAPLRLLVIH